MLNLLRTPLLALILAAMAAPTAHGQQILRVDDDAPPGGDGLSWDTAFRHLQDALEAATAGTEIRVAACRYRPDLGNNVTKGNPNSSFQIATSVSILGGFFVLAALEHGDVRGVKNLSILDGDLVGNDESPAPSRLDNAFECKYSWT